MTDRRPVVFLDRDGTLNVKASEGQYVRSVDELELLPTALEALALIHAAGAAAVVVTNQRGIARGHMSEADVDAIHAEIVRRADAAGGRIDAIYVCPHELDRCRCRKPEPGMILRAFDEHPDLDPRRAVIAGDSASDVEAGRRAGIATVRLAPSADRGLADAVAPDVLTGVRWALAQVGAPSPR